MDLYRFSKIFIFDMNKIIYIQFIFLNLIIILLLKIFIQILK